MRKQAKQARRQQHDDRFAAGPSSRGAEGFEHPVTETTGPAGMPLGFAGFERYTNGIGSRLMARMGWEEGMGLGRDRQGRAEPVRATMRPKGLGLGAGRGGGPKS